MLISFVPFRHLYEDMPDNEAEYLCNLIATELVNSVFDIHDEILKEETMNPECKAEVDLSGIMTIKFFGYSYKLEEAIKASFNTVNMNNINEKMLNYKRPRMN